MTVSGRIQTGTLVIGDQVRVMPVYELCTVKAMSDHTGSPCKAAIAGTNVEVGLVGLDSELSLGVGTLLCSPYHTIPVVRKFNARIQTLEALKIPIIKGTKFTMHVHNTDVPIHISKLIEKRSRREERNKKKPRTIGRDEIGLVTIVVDQSNAGICLELFEDYPAMGRVLLRNDGVTVAMGTVTKIKEGNVEKL
jgi:translation elongation factor EF-1alpha